MKRMAAVVLVMILSSGCAGKEEFGYYDAWSISADRYYDAATEPIAKIEQTGCPTITIGRQHIQFITPPQPWYAKVADKFVGWLGIFGVVHEAGRALSSLQGPQEFNIGGDYTVGSGDVDASKTINIVPFEED